MNKVPWLVIGAVVGFLVCFILYHFGILAKG
jgi:hypothetical protein